MLTGYSCGPHTDYETELRVVPLDQLEGERIPASRFLGPAAPGAIRDRIEHAERWNASKSRTCGYGFDFDIGLPLPESVVGYDRLPAAWNLLAHGIVGLCDAFSSPTEDLLIATTEMELRVYRLDHGRLGCMILRRTWTELQLNSREGRNYLPVVMAQWATCRDVARWSRELRKIAGRHRRDWESRAGWEPAPLSSPRPAAPAPPPSCAPGR
jgi:hypothetical protein